MVKIHMTKCPIVLIVREIQIKTTIRDHYTPIKMAKVRNGNTTERW